MSDLPYAIADIHIRNFRGIEDLKLSFCGPDGKTPNRLVVIGGPNGCGKTTVLEACLLALAREHIAVGKVDESAIRNGSAKFSIEVTLVDEGKLKSVEYSSGRRSGYDIPCWYGSSTRVPGTLGPVFASTEPGGTSRSDEETNRLRQLKTTLVNMRLFEALDSPAVDVQAGIGTSSANVENHHGQFAQVSGKLTSAWQLFYPDETFSLKYVGDDFRSGFDVYVTAPNRPRLSVDNMSSGQQELFLMIGQLAVWPVVEGVILIDEPELHLDPQWHRHILDALLELKPNCQYIIATHSPEIFHSATSFERHFLVPDDDIRAKVWKNMVEVAAQEQ